MEDSISDFPHLTSAEFTRAAEHLCNILRHTTLDYEFKVPDDDDTLTQIIIHREIHLPLPSNPNQLQRDITDPELELELVLSEDEETLHDPESLQRPLTTTTAKTHTTAQIEYHIVLSPSYAVPTLYFTMTILGGGSRPASLDEIYDHLVRPSGYKDVVEAVGVMGAISQGDHPINGMTYWFIHPCGTASTLEEFRIGIGSGSGGGGITLKNYLQIWLGFVGGCVGLHLPAEAVASQQVEK